MEMHLPKQMSALLLEVTSKHQVDLSQMLGDDGVWRISHEDKEQLLEAISAEFAAEGLMPDSEPNPYGLQLEALLDRVNRLR